ncbi:ATP-grasp domain-containing protein [Streptomyces sp. NPDC056462]|uniref:ATP-grasp domain-containing protein n=1 Tax=Streptomyces sp. NPDC056462 TaxID=3345826 RepID=UPI0036BB47C6
MPTTPEHRTVRFATGEPRLAPLTWSQRYYLAEMDAARPLGRGLTIRRVYELRSGVDEQTVMGALRDLLHRFEGLRSTVVRAAAGGLQRVHAEGVVRVAVHDVDGARGETETAAAVRDELAATPFDVVEEWPVRAALVNRAGRPRFLVLVFSHVAVDAYALLPVTDHLVSAVAVRHPDWPAARSPEPGRRPHEQAAAEADGPALRSADRALRRAAEVFRAMPAAPAARAGVQAGDRYRFLSRTSAALDLAAGAVSLRTGESVATVLASAMVAVDAHFAGGPVGYLQLLAANRSRPETVNAVVPCSQPVPFSVPVAGSSFPELVTATAAATLGALRFGTYPPDRLAEVHRAVERERGVRLDITPTLNYRPRAGSLPRRAVTEAELERSTAAGRTRWIDSDLGWSSTRYLSADVSESGVRLVLQVDTQVHSPAWAERWMAALERLLCAAATRDLSARELTRVVEESRTDKSGVDMPLSGTERTVVLVGAGVMAEGYLRAAQRMGLGVGLVETSARHAELAPGFPCIVDFEPVEGAPARDEAWLPPAMTLAARLNPDAVLGFAEPHVLATAILQHRLGVPGPGLDAATVSRNKAFQRGEFARAGLPQPAHRHTVRLSEASEWALGRLPVVVKPVSLQGSMGVERIDTPEQWTDVVRRRDEEGPLLVESFVEGPEYSVEALVRDGQVLFTNLTRKETTGAPYFVELFHEAGHGAERPVLRKAADELCRAVVAALRLDTGIAHLEFRARADDDLMIMEVAVRTPGDHILEIISLAHGFDVYEACLRLALNEVPHLPPTGQDPARSAGSLFLGADRAGVLASLDLTAWTALDQVVRHDARLAPGAAVRPAENSGDRLAYAVLDCSGPAELAALTERLRASARVDITDPGSG